MRHGPTIRVLVVAAPKDRDAVLALLAKHPELGVVGETARGADAVELTRRVRPQVVVVDGGLPGGAGIDATKQIMIETPTPVVVLVGVNDPAGDVADRALRAGAVCVVPKPLAGTRPDAPPARRLLEAVRAMAEVRVVRHVRPASVQAGPGARTPQVIAIAASTGGPAALQVLLAHLPAEFALPILVAQHISRGFTPGFVEWLGGHTRLVVKIAETGEALAPGCAYVAPDDRHLGVTPKGTIDLSQTAPIGGFRPSASFLFASVARAYGARSLAVILTGMGNDGLQGLAEVREAGGRVLAQDEESSVIFGMPGAAVAAGIADEVLPLDALAARIAACGAAREPDRTRMKGGRA